MHIKTVTITGADDSTSIEEMISISRTYPFVEWGILFSPKRQGESRYPSSAWVDKLMLTYLQEHPSMKLSAHLCGGYTKEFLAGSMESFVHVLDAITMSRVFDRYQLNFNASNKEVNEEKFFDIIRRIGKDCILQYNEANAELCQKVKPAQNVHFLYDSSGGRGTLESQWKEPIKGFFTGYAGGLSPENLKEELRKIEQVVGQEEIWIDIETNVRTNDQLDMRKVAIFLNTSELYRKTE